MFFQWITVEMRPFFSFFFVCGTSGESWEILVQVFQALYQKHTGSAWSVVEDLLPAAAATGRPEVPCMMPCNAPLYKRMWRLSSLLYQHAHHITSFDFLFF